MKKVLVTGFNAFGRVHVNPSELVIAELSKASRKRGLEGCQIIAELLPTEYVSATRRIKQLLRRERPDAVLCLGVAAGRGEICLERIALNLDDDALADNAGVVRRDRPIVTDGPGLYRSTLPLPLILAALKRRKVRARISNHAGTFLCNHIFYVVRHETRRRGIPAGFVHLPALKKRGKPGMSLATMLRGVASCVGVLADGQRNSAR